VNALEEEATVLQRWGEQENSAAMSWLRQQLKDQCSDQPN
jgi:hypothetical protein